METPVLEAQKREAKGSRASRRLRSEGFVPAVLYGLSDAPEALSVPRTRIEDVLRHGAHLVEISLGGKQEPALVKDVQYDHMGDEILHVDFARIQRGVKVTVTVPIEFEGHPKGVTEGGILEHPITDVEVECLPRHIPEKILADVSGLGIGEHLTLGSLSFPEGVTPTGEPELVLAIVTFRGTTPEEEAEAAEAEAEAAEPEIIGKKEEEEESED
jgi:large subunit ribosomal protein L25